MKYIVSFDYCGIGLYWTGYGDNVQEIILELNLLFDWKIRIDYIATNPVINFDIDCEGLDD